MGFYHYGTFWFNIFCFAVLSLYQLEICWTFVNVQCHCDASNLKHHVFAGVSKRVMPNETIVRSRAENDKVHKNTTKVTKSKMPVRKVACSHMA